MGRHSKRRIPKHAFTKAQSIGWHVNYRDPATGVPRRRRFGMLDKDAASKLYTDGLADHLKGAPHGRPGTKSDKPDEKKAERADQEAQPGSLLHVASNYLLFEEKRARKFGEPRRSGTISPNVLSDKKYDVKDFLKFINRRYGAGSAGKLSVIDLQMQDIET